MKTASNQMKKKAYYVGAVANPTYNGTRMQPGYAGSTAGSKLSRKAARGKL